MTGLWLATYLALWTVVILTVLLQVGVLRQLGMIQRQHQPAQKPQLPSYQDDGPRLGSQIPELTIQAANVGSAVSLTDMATARGALIIFMSPLCEGCHEIVNPLNALAKDRLRSVPSLVILRGNETSCRSFLRVFPLDAPVALDLDDSLTAGFGMHHSPYGLLYDENQLLVRKGSVTDADSLAALLGDGTVPAKALAAVFPPPVPTMIVSQSRAGFSQ